MNPCNVGFKLKKIMYMNFICDDAVYNVHLHHKDTTIDRA